jgi:uncharacterized damage-inducible protein DinB
MNREQKESRFMKFSRLVPSALALTVFVASTSLAQTPAAAVPTAGFRAEFLSQQDRVEKEILGLAEATPAEKYGWRPAPGVRSISEVYVHIVGGNYFLGGAAGIKPPAGLDREMEKKVTEKAKVIDELKQSFAHLRAGIAATNDADLDKPVKFFGSDSTVRGVLLTIANHEHEHLGQSIAYARVNGIVPPWTAEQQKRIKEEMEKKPAPAPAAK